MKYKYLRVNTKPKVLFGFSDIVAQVDVNHLNKRGIDNEWDKLDKEYKPTHFVTSLITVDREMREFKDEPSKYINSEL